MGSKTRGSSTTFFLILAMIWVSAPAGAQDDDGRTIWGEDYKSTLRAMKQVQRALGVKSCLHCHVKKDGKMEYELETEHKKIARRMHFAFVDTLAATGRAQLMFDDHGKPVKVTAVRKAKGEDAGILLTLVLPPAKEGETARTFSGRVALPAKDQPIECGTCHGGKLHFLSGE